MPDLPGAWRRFAGSSALLRLASKTASGSLLFPECVSRVRPPSAAAQADIAGAVSADHLIFAPDPLALDDPWHGRGFGKQ